MYSRKGGSLEIDSVVAVEGKFKFHPGTDHQPTVELLMLYMNKETSRTLGTCPVKTELLSNETLESLRSFLLLAEKDFARVALSGGQQVSIGGPMPLGKAESDDGLPKGIGD